MMFLCGLSSVTVVHKNTLTPLVLILECLVVSMLCRSVQKRCFWRAYSNHVWNEADWASCRGSWRLWMLVWRAGGDTWYQHAKCSSARVITTPCTNYSSSWWYWTRIWIEVELVKRFRRTRPIFQTDRKANNVKWLSYFALLKSKENSINKTVASFCKCARSGPRASGYDVYPLLHTWRSLLRAAGRAAALADPRQRAPEGLPTGATEPPQNLLFVVIISIIILLLLQEKNEL